MMMTDAYIRRHTQNDKFTDYRSIPEVVVLLIRL